MIKINIDKIIKGSILDIGGGGEGVIGIIYQSQVTAIDKSQEELDEAPEGFRKIVMDACSLEFKDNDFDNVTLFYTLMYIRKQDHSKVIEEAYRVLRDNGSLFIWDSNIDKANPFIINLNINANGTTINTTYGIYKDDAFQGGEYFKSICEKAGFILIEESSNNDQIYLHLRKISK